MLHFIAMWKVFVDLRVSFAHPAHHSSILTLWFIFNTQWFLMKKKESLNKLRAIIADWSLRLVLRIVFSFAPIKIRFTGTNSWMMSATYFQLLIISHVYFNFSWLSCCRIVVNDSLRCKWTNERTWMNSKYRKVFDEFVIFEGVNQIC